MSWAVEKYSLRKTRETRRGDNEVFECKFSRKRDFLPCPLKYRVHYRVSLDNSSETITVKVSGDEHSHVRDPEYGNLDNPNYFRWTEQQTDIVDLGCKNNLDTADIRRNLSDNNQGQLFLPTVSQLNNKIAHCRKKFFGYNILCKRV